VAQDGSLEANLDFGRGLLQVRPGDYKLCWGRGAAQLADFKTEVGTLRVAGPERGQAHRCARGAACDAFAVEGVELGAADRVRIQVECGADIELQGVPGGGVAEFASFEPGGKALFAVAAAGEVLLTAAGIYQLCWCRASARECSSPLDFAVDVGILYVREHFFLAEKG